MLLQTSKHIVLNLLRSKNNPAGKIFLSLSLHSSTVKDQYRPGSRSSDSESGNKSTATTWRAYSCADREHTFSPHKTCSDSQHGLTWSLQYHASKIPQILDYALSHPLCVHWIYMMLAGLKESFFWFPRGYPMKVWSCNTLNMLHI